MTQLRFINLGTQRRKLTARYLPAALVGGLLVTSLCAVGCSSKDDGSSEETGGTGASGGSAGNSSGGTGAAGSAGMGGSAGATAGAGGDAGTAGAAGNAGSGGVGAAGGAAGSGGVGGSAGAGGTGGGTSVDLVDVTIQADVLLANNYGLQLDPLFRSIFSAGSQTSRLKLFARFCTDAACNDPVALVPITVPGANGQGYYVFSTASTTGGGFAKTVSIPQAPVGTYYLQIVGDSEASETWGKGTCSSVSDCPGDADVVQMDGYQIQHTGVGSGDNPSPYANQITITGAGDSQTLSGTQYLGHIHVGGEEIWTPAPADSGTLVAAMSNAADDARNYIGLIDLADASATPGGTSSSSYTLQKNGSDFPGDVCALIPGGGSLYAIAVDSSGANVFELSGTTGLQVSDTPIVTIAPTDPNNANTYPWPCRGVYAEKGGKKHLYLVQFKGAGALDTSGPHPFYYVNVTDGTATTPLDSYSNWAWRDIAIDSTASRLVAVDMNWSKDSLNQGVGFNRLVPISLNSDGSPGAVGTVVTTDVKSDNQCGSTNHWPSGLTMHQVGGSERLLVGHDRGVAVYDPSNLSKAQDLDLLSFGNLFSQVAASPDGNTLYALPQCKADNSKHNWTLPYGASTEAADKNLVAILDPSGSSLAVKNTSIDVNGDGTNDHGIDLDYYRIKNYIRSFDTTMSIPPVVYTGPRIAVGNSMLFVRGTGIQGNGGGSISSSGLGQVQDIGFFDLATGDGVVFDQYMPFFDGLSSNAGAGPGIWGYDVRPGQESSVGALYYIP